MKNYSNRVKNIAPSATATLNAKTQKLKSQGKDIIDFSFGEPDFETPANITEKAIEAINQGKTKYTLGEGILELRTAIAEKLKVDNNLSYTEDQIVVSNGAKHSLFNTYQAILNDQDEVLLPEPYWVSYPELISLAGGRAVKVPTGIKSEFKTTATVLAQYITPKTKAIQLNYPSNPTGSTYSREELEEIGQLATENDLFIISDEIYEKILFDNEEHISIASLSDDLYERTITINGVSKGYAMTGWRIGYLAGNQDLVNKIKAFQSHSTSNVSSISQYAALEALTGDQTSIEEMKNIFSKRRNLIYSYLKEVPGVEVVKPSGAFYIYPKVKQLTEKLNFESSLELAQWFLEELNIAVLPGEAFGTPGYLRFSYANSEEDITRAFQRIQKKLNY